MPTENLGFKANQNTQGGFKFEPLRKFRWELDIFNLAGFDKVKLALKTCSRPNYQSDKITAEHFNDRFYLAGKTTYNEMTFAAYDTVPDSETGLYTSQLLASWKDIVFNPRTNLMFPAGGASGYKRDGLLTMYDGLGNEQVSWNLIGMWIVTLNYGDLDYGDSESAMVDVSVSYDKAFLVS